MFILAHLDIITIAVLMAVPYYFFNRYLARKIKPGESGKGTLLYFIVALTTAVLYGCTGILVMIYARGLLK